MQENLIKKEEVGGVNYVVQAVDAQTQYKIVQKLARYGIGHLIAGIAKAGQDKTAVKKAYLTAIVAIVQSMPENDQDFCLQSALKKTAVEGNTTPVSISNFTGRIAEYILLGCKAIGVQLGDFTCFLNLIPSSTAEAQEEKPE